MVKLLFSMPKFANDCLLFCQFRMFSTKRSSFKIKILYVFQIYLECVTFVRMFVVSIKKVRSVVLCLKLRIVVTSSNIEQKKEKVHSNFKKSHNRALISQYPNRASQIVASSKESGVRSPEHLRQHGPLLISLNDNVLRNC